MDLRCPLCSTWVAAPQLDEHLRSEIGYAAYQCLLCRLNFFTAAAAADHFRSPISRHPGATPSIAEAIHLDSELRIRQLRDQAADNSRHHSDASEEDAPTLPVLTSDSETPIRPLKRSSSSSPSRLPSSQPPIKRAKRDIRCRLCSSEVDQRKGFLHHVTRFHLPDNLFFFRCNHCEFLESSSSVRKIRRHCRAEHSAETDFSFVDCRAEVRPRLMELLERCFPLLGDGSEESSSQSSSPRKVGLKQLTRLSGPLGPERAGVREKKCRLCGKEELSCSYIRHVTRSHAPPDLVVFRCRLCPFTSPHLDVHK